MKLVHAKFYQGVKIGSDTHASITEGQQLRHDSEKQKCLAVLEDSPHGILIQIGNLVTLATWNNIQYAQYKVKENVVEVKKDLASALKKHSGK